MRRLSAEIGRPVTFAMLQVDAAPELWRELLELSADAARGGRAGLSAGRGPPVRHADRAPDDDPPVRGCARPSTALLALPFDERIRRLRDPEVTRSDPRRGQVRAAPRCCCASSHKFFPIGDPPDYEPAHEDRIDGDRASAEGRDAEELLYDRMLERDGRELFLVPVLNYCRGSAADPIREMMLPPARRARARRRRRALRDHLRRAHPDLHAHALGARSHARAEAPRRVRGEAHDARHRGALRPARPRHARARHEGRPERDRPRRPEARAARDGRRTCRPAGSASCSARTATAPRSWRASRRSSTTSRPGRCPAGSCGAREPAQGSWALSTLMSAPSCSSIDSIASASGAPSGSSRASRFPPSSVVSVASAMPSITSA